MWKTIIILKRLLKMYENDQAREAVLAVRISSTQCVNHNKSLKLLKIDETK